MEYAFLKMNEKKDLYKTYTKHKNTDPIYNETKPILSMHPQGLEPWTP